MAEDNAEKDNSYDDEIITLLHQVGQRLLRSEQDRKEFKHMLADLEEKSDLGERAYLTVQDKLHKTESAIAKRQKALEKIQKEQAARIEKAASMADKIEEAISQHARINRRLDKAAQEKARMIRKLDRIEDAVTETQDALQSKAMVLLTDQNVAGKNGGLQAPANDKMRSQVQDGPWWQRHAPVRTAAITAMILLGVFGGWVVNQVQLDGVLRTGQVQNDVIAYETSEPPSFSALSDYEDEELTNPATTEFTKTIESALAEETEKPVETQETATRTPQKTEPPAPEPKKAAPAVKPAPKPKPAPIAKKPEPAPEIDPMDLDDERLLANLNENPGALAAKLNEIAPAAGSVPEKLDKVAPKPKTKAKKASFSPKKIKEETVADFINGQKSSKSLRDRIFPDPNLPSVIREVENKAFEGMPEAQHDLAAIYTAGHGGVEINFERSALWFRESAIRGIANARYNLGVLYHQGLGVSEDINMAVSWYRAAAEAGHPEAQYNLGIAYIEGIGTRYDPTKAAHYFEEAAKEGILEAAYNLGLIHENGLTGESKPDTALYWYKQAADMGSPEAKIAMDQLAKTLGLFPEEVERLYGKIKEDKKVEAPRDTTSPKKTQKKLASQNNKDVEYIEAGPLIPVPAMVQTEENANETSGDRYAVTAQIQEQLIRVGLYPGPADGVNDTLTEDAIRAYQANYDLKQDGRPSEALLVHMMTSELGSSNEYGSRDE